MHTKLPPDPWYVCDDPVVIRDAAGEFVAMTLTAEETVADQTDYDLAKLIAVAPAMLRCTQALADLMEHPDDWPETSFQALVDVAAIKEAHATLEQLNA